MKLTKLERYTAYCIMLHEYEECDWFNADGFCWLIERLFNGDDCRSRGWKNNYKWFPELEKRKPKEMYTVMGAWFNYKPEGIRKRIEILKQCIEETRP